MLSMPPIYLREWISVDKRETRCRPAAAVVAVVVVTVTDSRVVAVDVVAAADNSIAGIADIDLRIFNHHFIIISIIKRKSVIGFLSISYM